MQTEMVFDSPPSDGAEEIITDINMRNRNARSRAACPEGGVIVQAAGQMRLLSTCFSLKSVVSGANQKDQREWLALLQGGSAGPVSVAQLH